MIFLKIYDQSDVSVELQDLHFDNSFDGAVVKIEITNNSNCSISIDLCDIWQDDRWHDC